MYACEAYKNTCEIIILKISSKVDVLYKYTYLLTDVYYGHKVF